MLIDLHCHTYPKSDDSFMNVDDLIHEAKALGLDGVCLTEHDIFWAAGEVMELSRRHDFLVLPGCEINTDPGHVLVFGLERYEFGMHRPEYLKALVEQAGGAIIAAHPYRRRFLPGPAEKTGAREEMLERASKDRFFQYCQAIEGLNGRGTTEQNRFSQDLGDRLSAPFTAGSDAHRVEQLGTAATEFPENVRGLDDLIACLRGGEYRPVELRPNGLVAGSRTE